MFFGIMFVKKPFYLLNFGVIQNTLNRPSFERVELLKFLVIQLSPSVAGKLFDSIADNFMDSRRGDDGRRTP